VFSISSHLAPTSLQEAVQLLVSRPDLKLVAGGTDVLIRIHSGALEQVALLSLGRIPELRRIALEDDRTISIGAMATFSALFGDETIRRHLPFLAEAAISLGGPQIRNVATIGGNLCNGAVSADSAPMLLALNARLQIEGREGRRIAAMGEFYAGPGKVHLAAGEILTRILISPSDYEGMGGCYIKHSVRKAMDIANLGVAALCRLKDGAFDDLRIALGVAAPVPIRCQEAELHAAGRPASPELIEEIGRLAVRSSKARDSWRASKAYREHLIEVLTARAVTTAAQRTMGCCHGK
jgi:xanthine dehydrogenase FAD-binding subunit